MKRILPLIILLSLVAEISEAQLNRYVVKLKNKGGTPFSISNPIAYLSQRAIDRRTRYGIPIDSTDLPVTPSYVTQIDNVPNVTLLNVSKWLNAVTIFTTDPNAIATINAFPFVQGSLAIASRATTGRGADSKFATETKGDEVAPQTQRVSADYYNYGSGSFNEIHLHNGEFLHNIGLRGQGMQIAMLDNGYNNYTALRSFDSMNTENRVLGTWDFVAREANVANDGTHGMICLSTIVANIPGQFIGKAPKASMWLFQTEDNASEFPIEEFNWACGAERSDSSGADVISSSLGYGYEFDGGLPNYPYSWLDGNTLMAAIAADLAAKKGILVFVAAGNAGTHPWRNIISPADADSAIAVGAVNTAGIVGNFSSYGPSGDGQIKPDMASIGVLAMIQNTNNTIGTTNGTSLACPNMAGLGTCLWQGFPEVNNIKILKTLQQAGSKASNPDDRVGYGIPDVKLAFSRLLTEYATSTSSLNGCRITIGWSSKDVSSMKYEIERKAPGELIYTKIGELNPQPGALLTNRTYQFNNDLTSGSSGVYSYRIRQIIDTASATFMAVHIDTTNITVTTPCIVTGTIDPNASATFVRVQPNPSVGSITTLVIQSPGAINDMNIAVYDMKGRLMLQMKDSKGSGRKNIELPLGKLSKGKYYIKVTEGTRTIGTTEMIRL